MRICFSYQKEKPSSEFSKRLGWQAKRARCNMYVEFKNQKQKDERKSDEKQNKNSERDSKKSINDADKNIPFSSYQKMHPSKRTDNVDSKEADSGSMRNTIYHDLSSFDSDDFDINDEFSSLQAVSDESKEEEENAPNKSSKHFDRVSKMYEDNGVKCEHLTQQERKILTKHCPEIYDVFKRYQTPKYSTLRNPKKISKYLVSDLNKHKRERQRKQRAASLQRCFSCQKIKRFGEYSSARLKRWNKQAKCKSCVKKYQTRRKEEKDEKNKQDEEISMSLSDRDKKQANPHFAYFYPSKKARPLTKIDFNVDNDLEGQMNITNDSYVYRCNPADLKMVDKMSIGEYLTYICFSCQSLKSSSEFSRSQLFRSGMTKCKSCVEKHFLTRYSMSSTRNSIETLTIVANKDINIVHSDTSSGIVKTQDHLLFLDHIMKKRKTKFDGKLRCGSCHEFKRIRNEFAPMKIMRNGRTKAPQYNICAEKSIKANKKIKRDFVIIPKEW